MPKLRMMWLVLSFLAFASCSRMEQSSMQQSQRAQQGPDLTTVIPVDPLIIKGTLPSGLTYYIRQNKKPEHRAELRLAVNAGSVLESQDQQGLAHFAEHMAFNGTEHFQKQELVSYLESIGMRFGPEVNAYTSFDETVYMLQLPTDSLEVFRKGFQVLEDWAHEVSYDSTEIDKERGVIVEEWRLGRGAWARIREKLFPVLFHDSRYAERLPIGKKEIIESFPYDAVKRFYKEWYRPELMAVIAVGDFDPKEVQKMIIEHFSGMKDPPNPQKRVYYPVPGNRQTLYAIAADSEATNTVINVYVKLPVEDETTVGGYRRSLVGGIYNQMLNERLSELTKQPNPPFLFAFSGQDRFVRTSEVYVLSAVVANNGAPRGLDALLTESKRVREHGFTATEFERAKKSLLRAYENSYNERDKSESRNLASEYIRNYLTQEPIPGITYEYQLARELVPGIALDEVNKLARTWAGDSNRVILVASPEKTGVTVPKEDELAGIVADVGQRDVAAYADEASDQPLVPVLPKPAAIASVDSIPELGVTTWTLANGVKVILKPTDFKNDEIRFSAFSHGGYSLVADSNLVPARTATDVLSQSGLGSFSDTQLRKKLAGKLVNVGPYISELSEGFMGRTTPQDLETLFQLVYLWFTAPRADTSAFAATQARMAAMYQNRSLSPEMAFMDTISATLSQYHPRFKPWTVETLKEMNLATSLRIYQERFKDPSDFTFLFVGNLDLSTVKPLVETYLGGLATTRSHEQSADNTYRYPQGVIEKTVTKGMEQKSACSITFTGPFQWTRENRFYADAMTDFLTIKLREDLREDLGGTYGVSVRGMYPQQPIQRYNIMIQFGCNPERAHDLMQEVFVQIDSLRRFGTTEDYLNKIKEMDLRDYEVNLKQNGYWLGSLEFAEFHGEDPRLILNYPDEVNSLTLQDLQDAAKQYLRPDNVIKVTLYPENWTGK